MFTAWEHDAFLRAYVEYKKGIITIDEFILYRRTTNWNSLTEEEKDKYYDYFYYLDKQFN